MKFSLVTLFRLVMVCYGILWYDYDKASYGLLCYRMVAIDIDLGQHVWKGVQNLWLYNLFVTLPTFVAGTYRCNYTFLNL